MISIELLEQLSFVKSSRDLEEKRKNLEVLPLIAQKLREPHYQKLLAKKSLEQQVTILSLIALGQEEIIERHLPDLVEVERFYASMGGVIGYHLAALALIEENKNKAVHNRYTSPPGYEIRQKDNFTWQAIIEGIRMIPQMGELYPVAGLGVRLNLQEEEGKPLPAAYLPFCGRSLLEGLVRDASAREYLYYKLFGKRVTIPIALMTCRKNDNLRLIEELLEKNGWFGRSRESFFLFTQLLVPVVTKEGRWSRLPGGELNLEPGGHGAIWKTAEERGVFKWFQSQKRDYLLVRQINNPIAGIDHGLLALMGVGKKEKKAFGFASCKRAVNSAEGVLVCVEREDKTRYLTNIEYTEFARYHIQDIPNQNGYSLFPSNTNILFADLQKLLPVIEKHPIPALHINMKTKVPYLDEKGKIRELPGGRLESMMQNISDFFIEKTERPLPTFVTYNDRLKTISATKRISEKGEKLLETPERAFEDLLRGGCDLLTNYCAVQLEEPVLFLYNPALGPLYEIIGQKLRGGRISKGSELQLEISELNIENLILDGSLLIEAKSVANGGGKCALKNVTVKNRGIDMKASNCFWKNQISRKEALRILLQGNSEFYAEDVAFTGGHTYVVPDGERWEIREGRVVKTVLHHPTWQWTYHLEQDRIFLNCGVCCFTSPYSDNK